MKFSLKLSVFITLLISIVLAVGSIVSVSQNFSHAVEYAVINNVEQLLQERYILEYPVKQLLWEGGQYDQQELASYAENMVKSMSEKKNIAILNKWGTELIFSSMPEEFSKQDIDSVINKNSDKYFIKQVNNKTYTLLSTSLDFKKDLSANLVCAYDITQIVNDRNRQIKNQIILNGILVITSALVTTIVSWYLTKPINRLSLASKKIADGAYDMRTNIKSKDEIGELSKSFDIMADAIEQNILQLQHELTKRNDFIAAFSHEVKTPMTAVIGYASILRKAPCEFEKQLEYSNIIYDESKRLEELSQRLMDVMELTEEKTKLVPVEICDLVETAIKQITPVLNDIKVEIDIQPKKVMSQYVLLESLLRNLAINAVKANPKDGKIVIRGKVTEDGKYKLSVIDKGKGINKHQISRVTEAFYKADKSRTRQQESSGSGLGLYLCESIAHAHGTSLEILSKINEGTTVSVNLEVAP